MFARTWKTKLPATGLIMFFATAGLSSPAAAVPTTFAPYLAGYSLGSTGAEFRVTTGFVIPRISCGWEARGFAPSAGVYTSYSTISSAGVFIGCYGGTAHYWPTLVVNGRIRKYNTGTSNLHPGDRIMLNAAESIGGTTVSVNDETRHFIRSWGGTGRPRMNSPWIGASTWGQPSGYEPVLNFGSVRFTTSRINDKPLGSFPSLIRYDMMSKSGTLKVKTGRLATGRTWFRTVFRHS